MTSNTATFYDLATIFSLRDTFATLDPADASRAVVVGRVPAGNAIGILAGSFDPLTNAHIALAQAALTHGGIDAAYFALSRHTVNKETRQRPTDVDRALALLVWLLGKEPYGLLLFNRGLYADQAIAVRAAFPAATTIRFIVGFDKAAQIFDPRYYTDRDAALNTLFAHVELLVAPRGSDGAHDLNALLARPENHRFRPFVHPLPFNSTYADASSTVVRDAISTNHPIGHLVPPESLAFVRELAPYAALTTPTDLDRYALRESLLAALASDRAWAEQRGDLRALLTLAFAPTDRGEAFRHRLQSDEPPISIRAWVLPDA